MNLAEAWVEIQTQLQSYASNSDISLGSKVVVLALVLLFAYFLLVGVFQAISIWPLTSLIGKLSTPELVQAFSRSAERFRTREVDDAPEELFKKILGDNKIAVVGSRKLMIINHLQSIFVSGCREASLDPATLMRHTEFSIFRGTTRLKTVLGSFIILGLLGTLLGLALSLGELPKDPTDTEHLMLGLNSLVKRLQHAFFPSILGIVFTLVGFIYYGFIVNFVFSPTRGELEKSTINSWIPNIFPAYSQKLIEKLESNATRIDAHFQGITMVAEFASQVKEETGDFKKNLEKGNQLVNQIQAQVGNVETLSVALRENFADKLRQFTCDFESTVNQLTSSQSEFIKLQDGVDNALIEFKEVLELSNQNQSEFFGQIKSAFLESVQHSNKSAENAEISLNTTFEKIKEALSETMAHNSQIMDSVESNLDKQNGEISRVLTALKQNESIFIEKFNLQNELVNNLVREVSDSVHSETINNRKVAEDILSQSSEKFEQIDQTLKDNLEGILVRFDRYDAPVREAATKIENTYDGVIRIMRQAITENAQIINKSQESIQTTLMEYMGKINSALAQDRGAMSSQNKELKDLTQAITLLNDNMSKSPWKRIFS